MANCMICNVEFNPASGKSKNFCPKHCAPAPKQQGIVARIDAGLSGIVRLAFLAVISVFVFALIHSCGESSGVGSFTYPPSVLSHNISTVDGNSELNVTLKSQGWDAGEADIINITSDMRSIMEHELKEGGQEQSIAFHLVGDAGGGRDDYGRPIPSRLIGVFDIDFSMADIREINWDHVYNFKLLNLARVSAITPAGAEVGKKYCEKNREYSNAFCDNFQP